MKTQSMTERGFTLVELLAVLVIMGILMALLLPAAGRMRESGRINTTRQTIIAMQNALAVVKMESGAIPMASENANGTFKPNSASDASGYSLNQIACSGNAANQRYLGDILNLGGFKVADAETMDSKLRPKAEVKELLHGLGGGDNYAGTVNTVLCDPWGYPYVWYLKGQGNFNWRTVDIDTRMAAAFVDDEVLLFSFGNQDKNALDDGNNSLNSMQISGGSDEGTNTKRYQRMVFSRLQDN